MLYGTFAVACLLLVSDSFRPRLARLDNHPVLRLVYYKLEARNQAALFSQVLPSLLQAPANAAYDAWHRSNSSELLAASVGLPVVVCTQSLAPSDKDYWLTLAAGLQVLGFTMLALDTSSSAAEAITQP